MLVTWNQDSNMTFHLPSARLCFERNTLLIPPENKVHFAEFGRIPFRHSCQEWSEHSCFTTVWGVKQNFWKLVLLAKSDSNGSDRLCLNDAIQSLASWKTCTSHRIVSASKPFNRPFRRCDFFLRMRFSFFAGRLSSPVVFSRPTTAQETQYNYRVRDVLMCFFHQCGCFMFQILVTQINHPLKFRRWWWFQWPWSKFQWKLWAESLPKGSDLCPARFAGRWMHDI